MTVSALSPQRIVGQVDWVLKKRRDARFIAIRSPSRGAWPQHLDCGERRFQIRWCGSPLEMREVLSETPDDGVVILTDLQETDLGGDVLARLCMERLFSIESWRMLGDAFQARKLDPRLRGCDWMADLLLENRPPEGYAPVPGGVLDADTAWRTLLSSVLGIAEARPDIETLLHWTVVDDGPYRFVRLPDAAQKGIAGYLRGVCGAAGELIIDTLLAGNGGEAVALGLVCEVVFSDGWTNSDLLSAAVRLEPLVGRSQIPAPAARLWAQAAIRVARKQPQFSRVIFQQAEDVLRGIHAFDHVVHSSMLPAAFDVRLSEAAAAIGPVLTAGGSGEAMIRAEQAAFRVFEHHQAALQPLRSERLRMALRLLRWIAAANASEASNFEDIALAYVAEGSFVDWARTALLGGDDLAPVSAVYVRLAQEIRARRERQNQAFASALVQWNRQASPVRSLTPIEAVLDRVVVSAASSAPVLLLVLDGMSFPVFRQLAGDLADEGWNELAVDGAPLHAAVSIIPTVTEVARASLLCGRICQGAANIEKSGFASHPGLMRITKSGPAPILFHKGELSNGGALADEVRAALADARHRFVAIVYNAVDDHLSGADQARPRWSLDNMQLLRPIFHEARNAGRMVVMTADHGHVLEDGSRQAGKGTGDRWRPMDVTADGEMAFTGARVLSPDGAKEVLVPWSELLRYGGKKAGYHGGATPQEVLVPLAVFSAANDAPLWEFSPPATPEWWNSVPLPMEVPTPKPTAEIRRRPKKGPLAASQPTLFAEQPLPNPTVPESGSPSPDAGWIGRLMTCDIYEAQCKLAGKGAARNEDVRAVLAALEARGRLPRTALARQIGIPLFRLNGLLSNVRRLINVDQSPILVVDDAGDWVELDVRQLAAQFEIKV